MGSTKNLDAYKLGIVLDASQAAKGIAVLKEADALANKAHQSLLGIGKGAKFGLADQLKTELKYVNKSLEKGVNFNLASRFKSELKEVDKIAGASRASGVKMGESAGEGFGSGFASTVSSLIGTTILPGIGTAAGAMIGSALNGIVSRVAGPVMNLIEQGISLNEQLELSKTHFTAFTGSAEEADKHLASLKKLSVSAGLDLPMLLTADQRLEEFNDNVRLSELELRAAAAASAAFGSGAEGFNAVADSLGLIAEKGELSSKTLNKLYKQGVNAPKLLSQALGLSEKKVKSLIAQNRLRGDVVAQLLSEEIVLQKGRYPEIVAQTTGYGAKARYSAQSAVLAQEGTENITAGMRDYYNLANSILGSSQASSVVKFINDSAGSLLKLVEGGVKTGVSVTSGIIKGMLDAGSLTEGIGTFVDGFTKVLKSAAGFDINSPSLKMIPVGESAAEGVVVGFEGYLANAGGRRLSAAVDNLTQKAQLEAMLQNPRVQAFLEVIKRSEVGNDKNPYQRAFGPLGHVDPSSINVFDSKTWPGMQVFSPTLHRKVWTHPYGPYQAEPGTYQRFARATGINDLSPHSQDMFAAWDLRQHPEALQKILSGDARGGMNALKGEWESFAVNPRGKTDQLAGLFNQLSIGGVPVSFSNPVPVVAASDLRGGTGMFITPPAGDTLNPSQASAVAGFYQKKYTQTLKDTVPILIDVNAQQDGVAQTTGETVTQVSSFGQALQRVPFALNETTDGFLVLTKSASELRGMADKGALGIERIAGLLGELSGLAPSGGQVGKKRGFLSKALGFAAPFLSFVPGVGGLLSTLAGIGSRAAGGDYGGALTGIAGGLQSGGAFRRDPSPTTQTNPFQGVPILGNFGHNPAVQTFLHPPEKRATGGPIRKGRAYVVGDGGRPEVFEAEEDGWIHPSLSDFAGRRGSRAHGGVGSMVEGVLERVEAQLARHADAVEALHTKIGSMPAHEVVTVGSNHQSAQRAIAEAWKARAARDPKVVEWMQRRNVGL